MAILLLFGIVGYVWLWPFVPPDQDAPLPSSATMIEPEQSGTP